MRKYVPVSGSVYCFCVSIWTNFAVPASCCTMSKLPLIDVTLFQCTLLLMPGSTCGSGTTGATCTPDDTRPSTPIRTAPTGTSGTTNCHGISGRGVNHGQCGLIGKSSEIKNHQGWERKEERRLSCVSECGFQRGDRALISRVRGSAKRSY